MERGTKRNKKQNQIAQHLLTIVDVSEYCKVSIRTVRRWVADDKLPAYKLGNQWRISPNDFDIFLKLRRK